MLFAVYGSYSLPCIGWLDLNVESAAESLGAHQEKFLACNDTALNSRNLGWYIIGVFNVNQFLYYSGINRWSTSTSDGDRSLQSNDESVELAVFLQPFPSSFLSLC